ncbi:MAG: two-component system sensor histidine kinase RppB [Coleofasciculus sp. G2-EDA-02]
MRLFNHQGKLLAFSPNQPPNLSPTFNPEPWQTISTTQGIRYRQFTIMLHSADANPNPETQRSSWGYLQIGRTLAPLDAEKVRIERILVSWLPLVLGLVLASSWWLSGLAMQPIYQSYRQQQQFTADAAHELRTPLASLLATVEAILRVPFSNPQDTHTMLRQIERQGRRLSHLIADLLQLTSLEQQSLSDRFQPCCLNDLISDLSEEFLELATGSDIQLTCDIPKPLIYVQGNEPQLYRLVSNLIDNAIRYTPAGNSINVSLEKSDHTAVIKVTDTGIGIAPTEQAHIFDRFYRVNRDRSRHTGGSGLGLAIAKAIAIAHHGSLQVDSKLGVGSTFTVRLPLAVTPPFINGQLIIDN